VIFAVQFISRVLRCWWPVERATVAGPSGGIISRIRLIHKRCNTVPNTALNIVVAGFSLFTFIRVGTVYSNRALS
jgi:hypothetical protein